MTSPKLINPFLDGEHRLRNGWWIALFFLVLAAMLLPILLMAQRAGRDVSLGPQVLIVVAASWVCQRLRRRPLTELTGRFDRRWWQELGIGGLAGAAFMLLPALILVAGGWVRLAWNPAGLAGLASSLLLFAAVAVAEELLFHGFVFQRLMAGLGLWPAQLLTAAFFLLNHLDNPGLMDSTRRLAGLNIYLASLLFGLAYARTRSLALPLGLHWLANWMQGGVLGFGVSGAEQAGLFQPLLGAVPDWLTGGAFGLEASLPGLVGLVITLVLFSRWKPEQAEASAQQRVSLHPAVTRE